MTRGNNLFWLLISVAWVFIGAIALAGGWTRGDSFLIVFYIVLIVAHLVLIWLRLNWFDTIAKREAFAREQRAHGMAMVERLAAIKDGTASDEDIQLAASFICSVLTYPTVSRAEIVEDLTTLRDQARAAQGTRA